MNKNHLQKFIAQVHAVVLAALLCSVIVPLAILWTAVEKFSLDFATSLGLAAFVALISTIVCAALVTKSVTKPVKVLQAGILESTPGVQPNGAGAVNNLRAGRELVTSLIATTQQMASVAENLNKENESTKTDLSSNFIANKLPLALVILDENQNIVFANDAAANYVEIQGGGSELVGKSAYTIFDMSFLSAFTLDAWIKAAQKSKPTAIQTWERVKLTLNNDDHTVKLFDLAAYYNHDNPNHYETILVFFDHTDQYSQDDQAMGFVALSVHELRTPLTLLRGYIEVFNDELTGKIDPELTTYMHKMDATAQQLTYFVNNILNVARIEQTGLELELHEVQWPEVLQSAVDDMRLRASVRGMNISVEIAEGLPTVGADRVSIYEVICNLLDNALKYSGGSKEVTVRTYLTPEGNVETTVTDTGVGIPSNAMRNLFDKFYRDHHKRDTIGGTGLGLYLSKIIVGAHSGHIWVKSKQDEGSTFGFTLIPFSKLADESKTSDNGAIVRGAHGWIKNHSLYRR